MTSVTCIVALRPKKALGCAAPAPRLGGTLRGERVEDQPPDEPTIWSDPIERPADQVATVQDPAVQWHPAEGGWTPVAFSSSM